MVARSNEGEVLDAAFKRLNGGLQIVFVVFEVVLGGWRRPREEAVEKSELGVEYFSYIIFCMVLVSARCLQVQLDNDRDVTKPGCRSMSW